MADSRHLSISDRQARASQEDDRSRSGRDSVDTDLSSPPVLSSGPTQHSDISEHQTVEIRNQVSREIGIVHNCMKNTQQDQQALQRQASAIVHEMQHAAQILTKQQVAVDREISQSFAQVCNLKQLQQSMTVGFETLGATQQGSKQDLENHAQDVKQELTMQAKGIRDASPDQPNQSTRFEPVCHDQERPKRHIRKDLESAYHQYESLEAQLAASGGPSQNEKNNTNPLSIQNSVWKSIPARRTSTTIHAPVRKAPKFHIDRFVR